MRYCNSGLKVSSERSDVAIVSTDGDRFEVKPTESKIVPELIRLGVTSPRSLKRNILVPFSSTTVKYLLGQTQVSSCEEEQDWFNLEKALDEIAGFAVVYENINLVKTAISGRMFSTISDENCFLLHKKFTEYDCRTHSEKTLKYIKYNLVRMVLDNCVDVEFFRLSAEDVEQLLNSPDLNLEKEVHVAEVVNKWISADRAKREMFRPKLLSTVRLFALSEQTAGMFADYRLSMDYPRKTRDVLLLIGGWLHRKACDRLEWYDPEFQTWNVSKQKLPMPLAYHGAVILGEHLYVFGGSNGMKTRCETWKLTPTEWKWEKCDNMMEPRNYISNSSVVYDGKIYVFGGQNWREISRNLQRSRTGEMYDPATNRWTSTASLHDMRSDCAAAVYNDQIFVCGGFNGDVILSSVEVYNPLADFFSRLVNLPHPLSGHCLIVHLNQLFSIGGFDGHTRQQKILVYHRSGEWRDYGEQLVQGRSTSSTCIYKGSVVAVGGFTSAVERSCEIILREAGTPAVSVSNIIRGKSALKVMVATNWRDHLEDRGIIPKGDLEQEDDDGASTSADDSGLDVNFNV